MSVVLDLADAHTLSLSLSILLYLSRTLSLSRSLSLSLSRYLSLSLFLSLSLSPTHTLSEGAGRVGTLGGMRVGLHLADAQLPPETQLRGCESMPPRQPSRSLLHPRI